MENEREIIKAPFCHNCESITETILIEQGGYEEFWGAKVWRSDYEEFCTVWRSDYEEVCTVWCSDYEEVCTVCHKDDIETIEVYEDDYTLVRPLSGNSA